MSHRAGVGVRSSLRVPTGGAFALSWDKTLSSGSDGSGSQTFSFSQPLLKGAWAGVDSATVRQARLEERIGILTFRRTAADLVVAVIGASSGDRRSFIAQCAAESRPDRRTRAGTLGRQA